jgi:hypothetical protein
MYENYLDPKHPANREIKAEHEDKIFPIRDFICRLGRVQDEQFKKLHAELVADGFPPDEEMKSWLFDYCFNSDVDEEVVSFEEYCDCDFMRTYRAKKGCNVALED